MMKDTWCTVVWVPGKIDFIPTKKYVEKVGGKFTRNDTNMEIMATMIAEQLNKESTSGFYTYVVHDASGG